MKFYSDITKKFYNTPELCLEAEKEIEKQKKIQEECEAKVREARAHDAKIVEEKHAAMVAAQREYKEALQNFVKNYGSYHLTTKSINELPHLFFFDF